MLRKPLPGIHLDQVQSLRVENAQKATIRTEEGFSEVLPNVKGLHRSEIFNVGGFENAHKTVIAGVVIESHGGQPFFVRTECQTGHDPMVWPAQRLVTLD